MATDITAELLREIRDGIQGLRGDIDTRFDRTCDGLDRINARLDQTNDRLDGVVHGLDGLCEIAREIIANQAKHRQLHIDRIRRIDTEVADTKQRGQRLEDRAGS